jgi:hypothetical protein
MPKKIEFELYFHGQPTRVEAPCLVGFDIIDKESKIFGIIFVKKTIMELESLYMAIGQSICLPLSIFVDGELRESKLVEFYEDVSRVVFIFKSENDSKDKNEVKGIDLNNFYPDEKLNEKLGFQENINSPLIVLNRSNNLYYLSFNSLNESSGQNNFWQDFILIRGNLDVLVEDKTGEKLFDALSSYAGFRFKQQENILEKIPEKDFETILDVLNSNSNKVNTENEK